MTATIVNTEVLGELILSAFVGGIGVTTVFAMAIYGSTRFTDLRREGNRVGAAFFATMATVALLAFAGSVALALAVLTDK